MSTSPETKPVENAQRDYWLDNAKFVLIVFVIMGHAIESIWRGKPVLRTTWYWIYFFHMPLFVMISGYFSKKKLDADRLYALFVSLIMPYLIFQVVIFSYNCWLYEKPTFETNIFREYHMMWFLPALLFWRIMAPIFQHIKYPLAVAVCVGLFCGFSEPLRKSFGMLRGLSFLPFFVLGLGLAEKHLAKLRSTPVRIAAVIVLVGSFFLVHFFGDDLSVAWMLHKPYPSTTKNYDWTIIFTRLGLYTASFVLSAAILSLIPAKKLFFSKAGSLTIFPLLLHLMILRTFFKYGKQVGLTFDLSQAEWLAWIAAGSLLIAYATTLKPVTFLLKPLVLPDAAKFKKYALFYLVAGFAFVTILHETYKPDVIDLSYEAAKQMDQVVSFHKKDSIAIHFDALQKSKTAQVSLGANDSYQLEFFKGKEKLGHSNVKRKGKWTEGLSKRKVKIPKSAAKSGFDRVVIRVTRGDRTYQFGDFQLADN